MIIYNTCEMLSENINYVFYESLTSIAPSVPTHVHTSVLLHTRVVGALSDDPLATFNTTKFYYMDYCTIILCAQDTSHGKNHSRIIENHAGTSRISFFGSREDFHPEIYNGPYQERQLRRPTVASFSGIGCQKCPESPLS